MPNPAWKVRRWGGPDAPWVVYRLGNALVGEWHTFPTWAAAYGYARINARLEMRNA